MLPSELLVRHVLPFVDSPSLGRVPRVCKEFRALADNDAWQHMLIADHGMTPLGLERYEKSRMSLYVFSARLHEALEFEVVTMRDSSFTASLEFANPWPSPVWCIFSSCGLPLDVPLQLCAEGYTSKKVDTGQEEKIVLLRGWPHSTTGIGVVDVTGNGMCVPRQHFLAILLPPNTVENNLISIGNHPGLGCEDFTALIEVIQCTDLRVDGVPIAEHCQFDLSSTPGSTIATTRLARSNEREPGAVFPPLAHNGGQWMWGNSDSRSEDTGWAAGGVFYDGPCSLEYRPLRRTAAFES